ncbi:helix-turn-helix domain-containing protein [Geodermatophilus sp. DSM 44513]|uniref:helix-turn-helix domain-containing protein n=1 Tax=Geodermatophilus sp. DSM 44513 TaxID=1528104 RepID=UPI0012861592|nr:helix-turn-helix domain-containing protein [Geodermatophilus sp. DSM 44513]WNV77612.1 helix-turn-helix domain-containing protein [Geodermatophilus sp. DSM 44513]
MGDAQGPREPVSSDPLLLTPEEAAEVLRVGRTTIYALMKAGGLRSVHIGRSCRIPRAELERYVQHLQAPPPPQPARTHSRRRRTGPDQDRLFDVVHSRRPERP